MSTTRAPHPMRSAYIWLALMFVGIVLGFAIGEVLPGLLGYGWTHEEAMSSMDSLLVGIPAYTLFIAPGLITAWYGWRARAAGARLWLLPFLIGLLVPAYFLLTAIVAVLFG